MAGFVVANDVDRNILISQGVPASQIVPAGTPGAVYVGAAGRTAPAGAQTLEGATRTETSQLVSTYLSGVGTSAAGGGQAGLSASGIINSILDPLGLSSLSGWAWQAWNQSGGSQDYVMSQLPNQPQFQQRFPEYSVLASQGRAMTPAQIVSAEQQAADLMEKYGIGGMTGYDPKTVTASLLEGNVSMTEFESRLQERQAAAAQYHPDVSAQMSRLGIDGDKALTAYVTDPKNALPMIQQQILAAQDAAKGVSTGFGQITPDQATHLAQQGVTESQAQQGFAADAKLNQLRAPLPGQANSPLTDQTLLSTTFDANAQAAAQVKAAQDRQLGYFNTGGGFAQASGGITGAGTANR